MDVHRAVRGKRQDLRDAGPRVPRVPPVRARVLRDVSRRPRRPGGRRRHRGDIDIIRPAFARLDARRSLHESRTRAHSRRSRGPAPRGRARAMLQGTTAHYLACSSYNLRKGDTALVHAAAGGVGLLLCQIAKMRGARVIGTVSSAEKAKLARDAGADETIDYMHQDFEAEVKRITGGKGVQVVYDGVGKTTWEKSLASLAPRGLMALYGASSGPIGQIDPQVLNAKGSLYLTRPSLNHYIATREDLQWRAGEVLGWVRDGKLRLRMEFEYPLKDAAEAHRALEGRKTTGKVLLIP